MSDPVTPRRRILFVDDEPKVLLGLQRMLRPMRHEWEMAFVESGAAALELLAREPFDVIVSDMRMPGMDGAQLLTEVMRRWPPMVRIVLSGHSDKEMILRSVGPTHQYLAKPCDAEALKSTVGRACDLRALLSDGKLKQLVSRLDSLPSLPRLYEEILEEMRSEKASLQKIGQIIARDIGMSAKILQLVNSAFFGVRRHVSDPAQAASLLGMETLKSLVLSVQVFSQFRQGVPEGFRMDALWDHSASVGVGARAIALAERADKKVVEDALMAGLLHDAGVLVLAANLPEAYAMVLAAGRQNRWQLWEAEREILGATHAEVGAYLLGLWGLPDAIVEALAFHHSPAQCRAAGFSPLLAVHVADTLSPDANWCENAFVDSPPDLEYLRRQGAEARFSDWRAACGAAQGEAKTA